MTGIARYYNILLFIFKKLFVLLFYIIYQLSVITYHEVSTLLIDESQKLRKNI